MADNLTAERRETVANLRQVSRMLSRGDVSRDIRRFITRTLLHQGETGSTLNRHFTELTRADSDSDLRPCLRTTLILLGRIIGPPGGINPNDRRPRPDPISTEEAVKQLGEVTDDLERLWGLSASGPETTADGPSNAAASTGRKPSVNARMLETIQKDTDAMGWSSPQWAKHLKCAKSTVTATQTWEDLKTKREREKAERALDRRQKRHY